MILRGLNRKHEPIEVHIENNIITKVVSLDSSDGLEEYIIPGFIDIHTHGGFGTDFVDNDEEHTRKFLRELPKEGTTSVVHATITTEFDNLIKSLNTAKYIMRNPEADEIRYLGVNIEGNFLNKAKKGAHKESLLEPLTLERLAPLLETNAIRMVSAAYENAEDGVIQELVNHNVIPSLAHSIATGEQTNSFVEKGLKGITHMFNAMPAFAHREDHSTNRALEDDRLYTEVIVDGIHVNREVVKLLYKVKPLDKILVITDSAPAKGMPDGEYMFGELEIYKEGNIIKTKLDDALAGSIATMDMCFKNFIDFTGCTLEEASIVTSTNQAKYLGLDNELGEIKVGYQADILILDKNYDLLKTISKGNLLYERN